jgi:hypothetical protein
MSADRPEQRRGYPHSVADLWFKMPPVAIAEELGLTLRSVLTAAKILNLNPPRRRIRATPPAAPRKYAKNGQVLPERPAVLSRADVQWAIRNFNDPEARLIARMLRDGTARVSA